MAADRLPLPPMPSVTPRVLSAASVAAAQFAAVGVSAYLLGLGVGWLAGTPSERLGAMWAAISGIVVLQDTLRDTWAATRARVLGTFIGALLAAVFLALLPVTPWGLGLCVGLTVLLCRLCGIADGGRLSSITVVVVMVISSMRPELNPFVKAALRFIEAGCGTGMALAVALASRAIAGHMRRPPPAAP